MASPTSSQLGPRPTADASRTAPMSPTTGPTRNSHMTSSCQLGRFTGKVSAALGSVAAGVADAVAASGGDRVAEGATGSPFGRARNALGGSDAHVTRPGLRRLLRSQTAVTQHLQFTLATRRKRALGLPLRPPVPTRPRTPPPPASW